MAQPIAEPESWLLRLFESDFFDTRMALSYLFRYPKNVGIQHYICNHLRKFPPNEIEFLFPQLWFVEDLCSHLIVSRPHDSAALEDFTMSMCQTSQHMAILTLWYLEAYLSDIEESMLLRTESYYYCKRLLRKCQAIIFAETNPDLSSPYHMRSMFSPTQALTAAHVPPTLVGMGLLLGSVALPQPCISGERMIMIQSKQARYLSSFSSITDAIDDDDLSVLEGGPMKKEMATVLERVPTSSPSMEELSKGSAFSFKNFLKKVSSKKNANSPLGGNEREKDDSKLSLDIVVDDSAMIGNNPHLVSSHFFHSEIQFIMSLVEISERLVLLPKAARQPSLLAELTLINHNLPANVCLPFWCPAEVTGDTHHQIVQIALSDCAVLNSAERVPYIVCIEVIESGGSIIPMHKKSGASAPGRELDLDPSGIPKERASDYFISVVSKRQSEIAIISPRPSVLKQNPVVEDRIDTPTQQTETADEFSNKMRTAAIMLAQLYQEQQKAAANDANHARSRTTLNTTPTLERNPKHPLSHSVPATPSKEQPQKALSNFEEIRSRVLREMTASELERVSGVNKRTNTQANEQALPDGEEESLQNGSFRQNAEDPSASVFREPWEQKKDRIKAQSPYGSHPNWNLHCVIIKSGADLRQEQLALQLITEIQKCWESFEIPIWVYSFRMLITSVNSGLVEVIPDSISIHSIKKEGYIKKLNKPGKMFTLYDHFVNEFGPPESEAFLKAQDNFVKSLAGYSLIAYLLQIKDRHNGNILIDIHGHITHIDFGFMLMNSPGSVGFELAPFKLPQEYIDIMGGLDSEKFDYFRSLMKMGLLALRKRYENIVVLVEIMEKDSLLPCFTGSSSKPTTTNSTTAPDTKYPVAAQLKERFQLSLSDEDCCKVVDNLIDSSCNNVFSRLYDTFQYYANGIL